jgi:hypothetical protein
MTQLVGEMATLKKRVNVLETEVMRKQQEETATKPAKKKKVEESLSVRLKSHPHLADQRFFQNWWAKGSSKCLSRKRCLMELQNMGVPLISLEILSTNYLCELYCLAMKLLLAHGAIDKLPVKVPSCYAHPGLTVELCMEKLSFVSGPVSNSSRGVRVSSRLISEGQVQLLKFCRKSLTQ